MLKDLGERRLVIEEHDLAVGWRSLLV